MRQLSVIASFAAFAALVVACGDNNNPGTFDAPVQVDSPPGTPDGPDVDAPPGTPDANVDAMPPMVDAGPSASQLIADARAVGSGTGLSLPIVGATVTYLKPVGVVPASDPAGFTIQASQMGPALFVAVDPTTLVPPATVGDVVSFTITDMVTVAMQPRVTGLTGWTQVSTGADVGALAQDISAATDVVSALGTYESEIIDVTATVFENFAGAGGGFQSAGLNSAGITNDPNFQLRVPIALRDSLDIVMGCTIVLDNTPVGRFNAEAQLAAFVPADIMLSGCPAPTVLSAAALSATTVRVTFDRNIMASSVMADGSQFTFDNGLTATAATVNGRTVDVTTTAQTGGTNYTVTVAASVTDLQGSGVGAPNTAMFLGFQVPALLRINEVNANIASACDLIELRVTAAGTMNGILLRERETGSLVTFPAFNVNTNDIIVVHMNAPSTTCNPNAASQETTSIIEQPSATFAGNFDTAYDFWSTDTGLTNTDNVFTLYTAAGAIMDAVFVDQGNADNAVAAATETQAATVAAANQWQMVGGGVPAGGFVDMNFIDHAVFDLDGTGTNAIGDTIQRNDNADNNDRDDWNAAPTVQTWGLINVGQTPL